MAAAMTAPAYDIQTEIGLQRVAEDLTKTLMTTSMARGVIWKDEHGLVQFELRLYVILGKKDLTEIVYGSKRDPDTDEFIYANISNNRRSVTDAWDEIITDWRDDPNLWSWESNAPRVMMDCCQNGFKLSNEQRQYEIFERLFNSLLSTLGRQELCCSGRTKELIQKLSDKLEEWFPE